MKTSHVFLLLLFLSVAGIISLGPIGALAGPAAAGVGLPSIRRNLVLLLGVGAAATLIALLDVWLGAGRLVIATPTSVGAFLGVLILGALAAVLTAGATGISRRLLFKRPIHSPRANPAPPEIQDPSPESRD